MKTNQVVVVTVPGDEIISTMREAANWGVNVSLGMAALLCVAFLVGVVIRKI